MWFRENNKHTEFILLQVARGRGGIQTQESTPNLCQINHYNTLLSIPSTFHSLSVISYFLMCSSCDISKLYDGLMNYVFVNMLFLNSSSARILCKRHEDPSPLLASVFSSFKWINKGLPYIRFYLIFKAILISSIL